MLGLAFLLAVCFTVPMAVLNILPIWVDRDNVPAATVVPAVVSLGLMTLFDWVILYTATPTFTFSGGFLGLVFMNLAILLICFAIENFVVSKFSVGTCGVIVVLVVFGIFCWIKSGSPYSQEGATKLANTVHVTMEPLGSYPDTDANHLKIVDAGAAYVKANSALSTGAATSQNLNTFYDIPNQGVLQSVQDHLYYLFPLQLTSRRNRNSVHGVVPGFIAVDAEDPNTDPQLHLGYKMLWTANAAYGHSLNRLIWSHFKGSYVDDVTFEVDDQWKPFYTASLNKSVWGWNHAVPQSMITVDPQTGQIQHYPLSQTPAWVDRIYSAGTAKEMMGWWGEWGMGPKKAPFGWWSEGSGNRFKVADDPVLVYTKEGPAWQMLLSSWQKDTAVNYIALFDTTTESRVPNVRLYRPDSQMTLASVALDNFRSAAANIKRNQPLDPAIHKIYGKLTWVVSFGAPGAPDVANGDTPNNSDSFHGVGLMQTGDTSGASAVVAFDENAKATALDAYQAQLAQGDLNQSPEESSNYSSVDGVVKQFNEVVTGGQTYVYVLLAGDPTHYYAGAVNDQNPELAFIRVGAKVRMTFLNLGTGSGGARRNIASYDDLGLSLGTK